MAYKVTLKMGDSPEYDVLSCSFSFNRSVDQKGRPSSEPYGGELALTVESFEDTKLVELLLNSYNKPNDGTITFSKGNADGVMKTITFTEGYVTSYSESTMAGGSDNGTVSVVINARVIKVGDNATHTNDWPAGHA